MSLTKLDQNAVASLLTTAWQRSLNTGLDPSNGGRWATNGANNDGVGLYGGLTDSMDSDATFDEGNKNYAETQKLAASSVVDNTNGLVGNTTVTLAYQYTDTVSTTHTTSHAVQFGLGFEFKAGATIFGIKGEATTKFSFQYTYTSSDASTSTQTHAQTVTQAVAVNPPAGKVYKAVLIGSAQELDIPYRVYIRVAGTTETWFEGQVNGHYNWMMDVGSAFGIAGNPQYMNAGNGQGLVVGVEGVLKAQQTTDFVVQIWDITAQYTGRVQASALPQAQLAVAPKNGSLLPPGAVLIKSIPVRQAAAA